MLAAQMSVWTIGVGTAILGSAALWLIVFLGRSLRRGVNDDVGAVVGEVIKQYMAPILDQFQNNGGSSLRDRVDSIDKKLDAHMAFHKGQESVK